jgi:hypothetical protein
MLTKLISTIEFLPQGSEPGRDRVYELDSSGGLIIRGNFVTERRSGSSFSEVRNPEPFFPGTDITNTSLSPTVFWATTLCGTYFL